MYNLNCFQHVIFLVSLLFYQQKNQFQSKNFLLFLAYNQNLKFRIQKLMEPQLNYYSRYNRIKVTDKKAIPSLYSLLNTQTLNKLANDATISLQMLSLYNRDKIHNRTQINQGEIAETQYLKANLNTFRSGSVDNSMEQRFNFSSLSLGKSNRRKKNIQIKEFQKENHSSKKQYLEKLVSQVREKSRQRVTKNSSKSMRKKVPTNLNSITKRPQQLIDQQLIHLINKFSTENSVKTVEHHVTSNKERKKKSPKKKLIKSLLSKNQKKQTTTFQTNFKRLQILPKQEMEKYASDEINSFVESINDENQKEQNSGPSVVLQRLKFRDGYLHQQLDSFGIQRVLNRFLDSQSKEDNPSENEKKSSEIKSFSKEFDGKDNPPKKNLILCELKHSQSQIWKPQQRSLEVNFQHQIIQTSGSQEMDEQKYFGFQFQRHQNIENAEVINKIQEQINMKILLPEIQIIESHLKQQSLDSKINEEQQQKSKKFYDSYPLTQNQNTNKNLVSKEFLSQINQKKLIQEPPFEHPLQTMNSKNQTVEKKKTNPHAFPKTSFKQLITKKQLNPRLVTSTILNDKNNSPLSLKEKLKPEGDQNDKIQYQSPIKRISNQKNTKINFKRHLKKKKQILKQGELMEQINKGVPLRRLQNQKLLQAFFNDN